MSIGASLSPQFGVIADLIRVHAQRSPRHPALILDEAVMSYGELDELMDRVAASLQRAGLGLGHTAAICASTSLEYVAAFLGALRAGCVVAPLAVSATPESLAAMIQDCEARVLFLDEAASVALAGQQLPGGITRIALDGNVPGAFSFYDWVGQSGGRPLPVEITAPTPFNVIYSSGTTGSPKGIVQSHGMRWAQVRSADQLGFDTTAVAICATPLYSNTTLVNLFPALTWGGTAVLMQKFDAERFLELAQRWRATHTMLVPVQYQRIMTLPQFSHYDLSAFRLRFCTSAPFQAALKREVLARWPGGLIEYYGMTEGGGTCVLRAHEFSHKLHTVGQPAPGHEFRIIDEDGRELPQGEIGEVVGRSAAMMSGYLHQPAKTRDIEWLDREGLCFIRTGDIGRFDEDGFLTLLDRCKDVIISGGFNIYPSDLEAVLLRQDAVQEAAVVGVASAQWGETPVAFVVLRAGSPQSAESIRSWANQRLGKTQRLMAVEIVESLPRNAIGKVLKRQLREGYAGERKVGG